MHSSLFAFVYSEGYVYGLLKVMSVIKLNESLDVY